MNRKEYDTPEAVETRLHLEHPFKQGVYLPIRRRSLRLPDCDYTSPECLCFVTFNVHHKCGVRFIENRADLAWEWMWRQFTAMACQIHAASLMPDHVHILLAPSGHGESVSDIVQRVKTIVCTQLRQQHSEYLKWQTSFYDHVLRNEEKRADEHSAIVHYVCNNPIKAGLGDDYPYTYRNESI